MDRKLIFGFTAAVIAIAGWWLIFGFHHAENKETYTACAHIAKIERISVWHNGKENVVEKNN